MLITELVTVPMYRGTLLKSQLFLTGFAMLFQASARQQCFVTPELYKCAVLTFRSFCSAAPSEVTERFGDRIVGTFLTACPVSGVVVPHADMVTHELAVCLRLLLLRPLSEPPHSASDGSPGGSSHFSQGAEGASQLCVCFAPRHVQTVVLSKFPLHRIADCLLAVDHVPTQLQLFALLLLLAPSVRSILASSHPVVQQAIAEALTAAASTLGSSTVVDSCGEFSVPDDWSADDASVCPQVRWLFGNGVGTLVRCINRVNFRTHGRPHISTDASSTAAASSSSAVVSQVHGFFGAKVFAGGTSASQRISDVVFIAWNPRSLSIMHHLGPAPLNFCTIEIPHGFVLEVKMAHPPPSASVQSCAPGDLMGTLVLQVRTRSRIPDIAWYDPLVPKHAESEEISRFIHFYFPDPAFFPSIEVFCRQVFVPWVVRARHATGSSSSSAKGSKADGADPRSDNPCQESGLVTRTGVVDEDKSKDRTTASSRQCLPETASTGQPTGGHKSDGTKAKVDGTDVADYIGGGRVGLIPEAPPGHSGRDFDDGVADDLRAVLSGADSSDDPELASLLQAVVKKWQERQKQARERRLQELRKDAEVQKNRLAAEFERKKADAERSIMDEETQCKREHERVSAELEVLVRRFCELRDDRKRSIDQIQAKLVAVRAKGKETEASLEAQLREEISAIDRRLADAEASERSTAVATAARSKRKVQQLFQDALGT
eukprot:TRINITY_DN4505_c0_g2_i1.p1 TRINITY_DN4505_c0_g2~~TRINITY_DN4505_c0_g2_i1.p1  ORF type:complete len:819 (-),score=17.20 TRINITY_DN4505_c0_g2_i1:2286-4436(-)